MIMPKLTVSNYPEMLRKLSTATFFVTAACLELLRSHVDYMDGALKHLDIMTPAVPIFGPVKISIGIFLVAFVVACISEAVKLHDKISDVLSIRSQFDLRLI